jgi:hypothetical protein
MRAKLGGAAARLLLRLRLLDLLVPYASVIARLPEDARRR